MQREVCFLDGVNTDITGNIQICVVADLYADMNTAAAKSNQIIELINSSQNQQQLKYHYCYDDKDGKARFTVFAPPEMVIRIMEILK